MTTLNANDLLTVEQMARMMQVNPRTIRNRMNAGLLPAHKLVGGKDWRIRRADAETLLQLRTSDLSERPPIVDRLSTHAGRARAVEALRSLREGDAEGQSEILGILQKAEREQPLSLRSWDIPMLSEGSAE